MTLEEAYTIATIIMAIFTVFSSLTSAILFIILIYDHLKDDKNLFLNVQAYYEDVENLIYTHYQYIYFARKLEHSDKLTDKSETKRLKKKYKHRNQYFSLSVENKNSELSKYLGLIIIDDNKYLNKTDISLREEGHILHSEIKETMDIEHIPVINEFLRSLRVYWNKKFSKRIILFKIRGKLKPGKNFKKLELYENSLKA